MLDKQSLLNQYQPVRHQIMVSALDAMAKLYQVESDLPKGADNLPKSADNLSDGADKLSDGVDAQEVVKTTLWGKIGIDAPKCSNCQFCSKFCPTGALQSQIDKTCGELTITHTPALCVQCGLCADICQTNAISLNSGVVVADLREQTVHTIYKAKVENLTTPFGVNSPAHAIQSIVGADTAVRLR